MAIVDLKAAQKWKKIPKDIQEKFIENVFCSKCGVTTIVDYNLLNDSYGILLQGKCKKCGNAVTRMIEDF